MVVGAGVGGIQAALDAAASGFRVYLVDKSPAIGGKMSQLDKTFPTNDCSMCILSPKFIECATNPNITILTNTRVEGVEGEAGDFEVRLVEEPRYVDEEKCTGCGTCAEYCPVYVPDTYNEKLARKKCIHVHFPQAVPAVSVIDAGNCLFLKRKICQICVPTCKGKAIDFRMQPRRTTARVGCLVLAPGYETFDPTAESRYAYHRLPNVVTSLEFRADDQRVGPQRGRVCAARPTGAFRTGLPGYSASAHGTKARAALTVPPYAACTRRNRLDIVERAPSGDRGRYPP